MKKGTKHDPETINKISQSMKRYITQDIARERAMKRWENTTPEQRKAHSKYMNDARLA